MKTVLLLPVVLLIGSCSGSSDKIDADSDSLVAEKVETVEKDDFVSPDLLLFQLVGRVKCCITHCEYADTKGMMSDNSRIESVDSVYFSPKGLLTEMVSVFYNGDAVGGIEKIRLKYDADGNFIDGGSLEAGNDGTKIHIRRDADGYMTNYDVKCADADGLDDVYTSYIWKDGCLVEEETTYWEWQESVKYEYADAVVKSKTTLSTGYEEGTEIVETYAYPDSMLMAIGLAEKTPPPLMIVCLICKAVKSSHEHTDLTAPILTVAKFFITKESFCKLLIVNFGGDV